MNKEIVYIKNVTADYLLYSLITQLYNSQWLKGPEGLIGGEAFVITSGGVGSSFQYGMLKAGKRHLYAGGYRYYN